MYDLKPEYIYARLNFQWKPSSEIDMKAIQAMRNNFPKPKELPYVAWFMGDITYYPEVDINTWSDGDLDTYLRDTRTGLHAFARLKTWVEWFHYLLPDLILKAVKEPDSNLHDAIIKYFLVLYRYQLHEEYFGYRRAVFKNVASLIMNKRFWENEEADFNAPCWLEPIEELRPETDGLALEYSMIFCLKFLTSSDFEEWVKSIADIKSLKWQKRFKKWLKDFEDFENVWNVPSENIELFRQEIAKHPQFLD